MSEKHYKTYCKSSPKRPENLNLTNGNCMQKVVTALVAPTTPLLEPSILLECMPKHDVFTANPYLQAIYNPGSLVSREFEFPLDDAGFRKVEEIMLESRFSFHIPIQYLKMCLDIESKKILALKSICKLSQAWEPMRQERLEINERYFEKYKSRLEFLERRNEAPYFKKSTNKTLENLDFVPINLHLQRMRVDDKVIPVPSDINEVTSSSSSPNTPTTSSTKFVEYDIITVGAATNHSMGFKHGGLLGQLLQADDIAKSRKSLNFTGYYLNRDQPITNQEHLLERITTLNCQVKGRIEELKTFLSSFSAIYVNNDKPPADIEVSLSSFKANVCDFLDCCGAEVVASNVKSLTAAQLSYKPLPRTNLSDDVINTAEVNLEKNCENVKVKLEEVLKSFESFKNLGWEQILGDEASINVRIAETENMLSALQPLVEDLFSTCSSTISFYLMKEDKIKISPELTYRRNCVFSQSLSLCACAVATLMTSSLHKQQVLEQFAEVGIFLQVESLLSTHANEMGMLQDYVIGIFDLAHVTFRCVRADEDNSTQQIFNALSVFDRFLPLITGRVTTPTVVLPFDDESFNLLPSDLRAGKLIRLFPVIFNIGINEEQTLAHRIGDTTLQEYLNNESYEKTSEYCKMVKKWYPALFVETSINSPQKQSMHAKTKSSKKKSKFKKGEPAEDLAIEDLLKRLHQAIHIKKHKNVEVLQLAAEVCRRVNGARVTSCKSAKDRTAMGVTLEQARILRDNHSLAPHAFMNALHCMRSEGTRPENTMKNTGSRQYAFSHFQLKTFPKLYRPPESTYRKGDT